MSRKNEIIFLLIILIIAGFFRLWQLNSIPPGLYPDVALNGNEALQGLKIHDFKVFYPENNGREGLMMWLIALSFSIFGVSVWSMKIVAAVAGILTVFGLYLLTKELFSRILKESDSRIIALASSFFLAISFWHTNFSRIGFRAILLPFVLVFAFYFLFKGLNSRKLFNFIISGIFFGLGFYTYTSYRLIVLPVFLVLIIWWFIYRKQNLQKKFLLSAFYFLLSIFIVALPLGIYFLESPQDFISRAGPVSVFAAANPLKALGESLIGHLAMFNFYGDSNWRHNYSGSPMLFWPVGILFLIGFILSIKEILKKSNYQSLSTFYFLISTFFVMLLPGVLTYEGIPHSLRVIGAIPTVYIFVGLGSWWLYEKFRENVKNKNLLFVSVALFLVAVSMSEFNKYFFEWGKSKEVEGAFTKNFADMGYFLNSLPENYQKYVIVNESGTPVPFPNGIPMPVQTIMFMENAKYGSLQSTYLLPANLEQIKIDERQTVIIPMKYDENLFNDLKAKFPQGKIQKENEIWLYEINPKIINSEVGD